MDAMRLVSATLEMSHAFAHKHALFAEVHEHPATGELHDFALRYWSCYTLMRDFEVRLLPQNGPNCVLLI